MWQEHTRTYFHQFTLTLRKLREAVDFTYKHRLWEGFWRYGWVGKFMIIVALITGLKFLSIFFNWLVRADRSDPLAMINSMGLLVQDVFQEGYHFMFFGGMKYVMIVLLEILIFHICRRTVAKLLGREVEPPTFEAFSRAQIRMIKVAALSFVLESVATLMLKIFFGIFGFIDFLQPVAIFAAQCYFVGFAVLDNYLELFGMTIRDSLKYAQNYVGVALAVGLFLQAAFSIPLAGTVAGPILASVAVCLTMYKLSDLHRREAVIADDYIV